MHVAVEDGGKRQGSHRTGGREAHLKLGVLSSAGRSQKSREASEDRQQETISSPSLHRSSQEGRQVPFLSTGPRKGVERAGGAGGGSSTEKMYLGLRRATSEPLSLPGAPGQILPLSLFPHFRNSSETHLTEGLPGSRENRETHFAEDRAAKTCSEKDSKGEKKEAICAKQVF